MGEHDELRPWSRVALLDFDDLIERQREHLYVLTYPEGTLELHTTEQGEVIFWLYSDIQNLVESCGSGQPYVRAAAIEVAEFASSFEAPTLAALDVWHPHGARYAEPNESELEPLQPLDYREPESSVVWIPTRPVRTGDRLVNVELYCIRPSEPLLLVFDSLEALIANCGPHQAASAISTDRVDEVAMQAGACGIAYNAVLAEEARHDAPVKDWTRTNFWPSEG
ncbi:MAG: hypothetical protein ACRDSE_06395 [Pseudonocardiaceae bacterium]